MTTEFVLIRHGQTNWNIDHRYQGVSQTPLNETGLLQAAALAGDMEGDRWDVLASSPLARLGYCTAGGRRDRLSLR